MTDTANAATTLEEPTSQATPEGTAAADTTPPVPEAEEKETPKGDTLLSGDGGAAEGEGGEEKAKDEGTTPEAYTYTPPEGAELTEAIQQELEVFQGKARELGLTQEQYQALVDYEVERGGAAMEARDREYSQRVDQWAEQVRQDTELGGTKEEVAEKLAVSKRALDRLATPELRALVSRPSEKNPHGLGLGNHPEFVRLLYRIGKELGESEMVEGSGGEPVSQDAALRRMYPTMYAREGS